MNARSSLCACMMMRYVVSAAIPPGSAAMAWRDFRVAGQMAKNRASKEIGSSLEANLSINLNEKMFSIVENIDFSELCITSGTKIQKSNSDESAES